MNAAKARTPTPHNLRRDHAMEVILAKLLTSMMAVAGTTILIGLVLAFVHQPQGIQGLRVFTAFTTFKTADAPYRTLLEIRDGLLAGDGLAIVQLGLFMLIATPIVRVCVSLILFARVRDWMYVSISALVLTGLALGLLGWIQ